MLGVNLYKGATAETNVLLFVGEGLIEDVRIIDFIAKHSPAQPPELPSRYSTVQEMMPDHLDELCSILGDIATPGQDALFGLDHRGEQTVSIPEFTPQDYSWLE